MKGFRSPRIVAADTGGALLDEDYQPLGLIATAAVLVERPYLTATACEVRYQKPEGYDMSGRKAIVEEIKLAAELARKFRPDAVHIDSTIGGIEIRKLDEPTIDALRISDRGKEVLKDVSDEVRRVALRLWEDTGIDMIATGKPSVPVRIAEICSGVYTVIWALREASSRGYVRVGLPKFMKVEIGENSIVGRSIDTREGGLYGEIGFEGVPENVRWELYPNPTLKGFMVFEAWTGE
ncbi:MAG: DUF4152 domain-containing protein [Thermococci archaeon]|nr:DUF4152 domain-containing protein [Thermococci archaeon]